MPNKQPELPELVECVQMKNQIQAELTARYEGLSESARQKLRVDMLMAHPFLGPFYLRLKEQAEARRRNSGDAAQARSSDFPTTMPMRLGQPNS